MDNNSFLKEDGSLITFSKKAEYIGSFLVTGSVHYERAEVVRQKLEAARAYTQSKPIFLLVSLHGIKVCDELGENVHMAHALRRISYATCDPDCCQFAFLAREPKAQPNVQYCHAFVTKIPDEAEHLNNIVGEAFRVAYAQQCMLSENHIKETTKLPKITNPPDGEVLMPTEDIEKDGNKSRLSKMPITPFRKPDQKYALDSGLSSSESGSRARKSHIAITNKPLPPLPLELMSVTSSSVSDFVSTVTTQPLSSACKTSRDVCSRSEEWHESLTHSQENDTPTPLSDGKSVKPSKTNRHQRSRVHHHRHNRHRTPNQGGNGVSISPNHKERLHDSQTSLHAISSTTSTSSSTHYAISSSIIETGSHRLSSEIAVSSVRHITRSPTSRQAAKLFNKHLPCQTTTTANVSSASGLFISSRRSTPLTSSFNIYDHATPECCPSTFANPCHRLSAIDLAEQSAVCNEKEHGMHGNVSKGITASPAARFVSFSEADSTVIITDSLLTTTGCSQSTGGSDSSGVFSTNLGCSTDGLTRHQLTDSRDIQNLPQQLKTPLYTMDNSEISSAPWYQPNIPREVALELLAKQQQSGSFIVRDSGTHANCYALSVRINECDSHSHPTDASSAYGAPGINHYLIQRMPKGVKLKGLDKEWPSLSCLILHLTVMPEMLDCPLRLPLSTTNPTFTNFENVSSPRPCVSQTEGDQSISSHAANDMSALNNTSFQLNRHLHTSQQASHGLLDPDDDYQCLSDFSSILADLKSRPLRHQSGQAKTPK